MSIRVYLTPSHQRQTGGASNAQSPAQAAGAAPKTGAPLSSEGIAKAIRDLLDHPIDPPPAASGAIATAGIREPLGEKPEKQIDDGTRGGLSPAKVDLGKLTRGKRIEHGIASSRPGRGFGPL
ncbi:MAG: hypothetical protein ABSB74_19440 [Tepidisphaeraceae bacterium]